MSRSHGALNDARKITSSLSRAEQQLESSIAQAEVTAGALGDDASTIKVRSMDVL